MIRVKKVDEVFKTKKQLDHFEKQGTSHVLQVMWSEPSSVEIVPAMEFSDFWYAFIGESKIELADWFSPTHDYCAIKVLNVDLHLEDAGLDFPRKFSIPFVDRRQI